MQGGSFAPVFLLGEERLCVENERKKRREYERRKSMSENGINVREWSVSGGPSPNLTPPSFSKNDRFSMFFLFREGLFSIIF